MSRPCLVLCEDKQQSVFISRFLKKRGWLPQVKGVPEGSMSGEQYVREEYPVQLELARKKKRALIVMIDGDNLGAQKRMRQLEEACRIQGVAARNKKDAVAVFVPETAIENWIHYLNGGAKGKLQQERNCIPAVKKLVGICDGGGKLPDDFPPSLSHACDEWRQFRKVAP